VRSRSATAKEESCENRRFYAERTVSSWERSPSIADQQVTSLD